MVVSGSWQGNPNDTVLEKIAKCEDNLKEWSKLKFGSLVARRKKAEKALTILEKRKKNGAVIAQRRAIEKELNEIMDLEEEAWKQRSRTDWLQQGDRNTPFFHRKASDRRNRNTINFLLDQDGVERKGQKAVTLCIRDYYQMLFKAAPPALTSHVLDAISCKITDRMNEELLQPITREEIWNALRHMGPTKAPGADGMLTMFFQKYWHVIGDDVTKEIQGYMDRGEFPQVLNHTLLALIPKTKKPKTPAEFRPISLCKVLYKIFSKVLANKLKKVLKVAVVENQSAFVPGRYITDNVIVAFECFHAMKTITKGKKGYMAAKLDIAKAYDRVSWKFLEAIIRKLGFADRWVRMIMYCVSTVSYAALVKGHQSDTFFPTRGLRKGDPISPYLFLLVAEGLSALTAKAEAEGFIQGLKVSQNAPMISHLLFADDSISFIKATRPQCSKLKEILSCYEVESGQSVSLTKSEISFSSNIPNQTQLEMADLLGMKLVEFHEKYLGLPTVVGRKKRSIFSYLVDRIRKKVKLWKSKLLSSAAKEVLIKC
ncbi:unnamed protein product [Linum trigynum]|uniref:Reverse transcriptase domain-containing protein n=1 Tax=Linum trigynum TaxID=586398 RepID=A0AAV2EF03_9ROSI